MALPSSWQVTGARSRKFLHESEAAGSALGDVGEELRTDSGISLQTLTGRVWSQTHVSGRLLDAPTADQDSVSGFAGQVRVGRSLRASVKSER